MTKFRAVAHLGISGGGWTESKKLIWTRLILSRPLRQAQGRLYGTLLDQYLLTNRNSAKRCCRTQGPGMPYGSPGRQAGRAKEGLPAVVGGSGRALCSEGVGRGLVRLAQLFVDGHVVVDLRVLQGGAG
jgi:hypothetical protein